MSSYSDLSLIVDRLLEKIEKPENPENPEKIGAKSSSEDEKEDSRKEEIVFLLNEIIRGRVFNVFDTFI